jgi:hypothetical protein
MSDFQNSLDRSGDEAIESAQGSICNLLGHNMEARGSSARTVEFYAGDLRY